MLNELVQIGIYAKSKYDEIENFITIPNWKFYIFPLIFDWNNLVFKPEYIKEWTLQDLKYMWFKPPKWRVKAILPNVYLELDKNWNIDNKSIKSFLESLQNFSKKFFQFKKVSELIKNFNFEQITEKLKEIPNKDTNKKYIYKILSLKVSNYFVKQFNFTILEEKENYYLAEIKEIKDYFLDVNKGKYAKFEKWFCYMCENFKNNIINFAKSKNVNFPYKFFNTDKPGFFYDVDKNNFLKNFWICQDCYALISVWYNFFKTKLNKTIFWLKWFVFPSIYFTDKNKIIKIYEIFDKYSDDKSNLIKIENNIKTKAKDEENEFLKNIFRNISKEEKEVLLETNFVRLNFIFWNIDPANSDMFKIQFFLKDVLPSKVNKFYESIEKLNYQNLYEKYFQNLVDSDFILKLPKLYLSSPYEKWKYRWNIKDFFIKWYYLNWKNKNNEENYYQFLNHILYWKKLNEDRIFNLIYKKLVYDFKNAYLKWKDSKGWFVYRVWETILILEYLKENEYLDIKLSKMENILLNSENEKIKKLENWFNQNDLFDTWDKIYIALIWLYVKLLVNLQYNQLKSTPFMNFIDFENLDYDKLEKLLFKARDKFNKYSDNKFDYHPELFKIILQSSMKIKKDLNPEKLVYYFSIWMEILPKIYYSEK